MKTYQKLVRDFIPDIVRANGQEPLTRCLNEDEYRTALRAKILEEASELVAAECTDVLDELADLLEVMRAVACTEGFEWNQVEAAAIKKREKRGGFERRIWLERVLE